MHEPTAPPAITSGSTEQRLDALIRRHGGKPRPLQAGYHLPPVGKRTCKDQLDPFGDTDGEPPA
jgi:hypothetical protein